MTEAEHRQQAHELIEQLPARQLPAIVHLLRSMADPVSLAIANAPIDDEPLSEDGIRALEAAREWLRNHEPIPNEEVMAEFGFTADEIQSAKKSL